MKIGHFSKLMKLNIHLLLCSKDIILMELNILLPIYVGEKPQFESNVTSFQFCQNASARRFGGDYIKKLTSNGAAIHIRCKFKICWAAISSVTEKVGLTIYFHIIVTISFHFRTNVTMTESNFSIACSRTIN